MTSLLRTLLMLRMAFVVVATAEVGATLFPAANKSSIFTGHSPLARLFEPTDMFNFDTGHKPSPPPSPLPTLSPTSLPSVPPYPTPTPMPSQVPTPLPTYAPTASPSSVPSISLIPSITPVPTATPIPTLAPAASKATPAPTVTPRPTLLPTGPNPNQQYNSWDYIATLMEWYLLPFGIQYVLFEVYRSSAPHVYESRRDTYTARCSADSKFRPPPPRSRWPLGWVWPMLSVNDEELLDLVGLDAYVMVRYIRLCWYMCAAAAFVCVGILVPVYSTAQDQDDDTWCTEGTSSGACEQQTYYKSTLRNVVSSESDRGLWVVAVVAIYVLSAQACVLIRHEYRHFRNLRTAFFVKGDPSLEPQALYTVIVENVPPQYRLNVEFRVLFDTLFPGKVHSSEVMSPLEGLRVAVANAETCAEKLEDALAQRKHKFPVEPTVLIGPWHERWLGPFWLGEKQTMSAVAHWRAELKKANEEIAALQRAHFEDAIPREEAARKKLLGSITDRRDPSAHQNPGDLSRSMSTSTTGVGGTRGRARSEGHVTSLRDTVDTYENQNMEDGTSLTTQLLRGSQGVASPRLMSSGNGYPGEKDELGASRHQMDSSFLASSATFSPFGKKTDPVLRLLTKGSNASARRRHRRRSERASEAGQSLWRALCRLMSEVSRLLVVAPGNAGSTGFVTFNSLAAATTACQLALSHKAYSLKTSRAPEPRGLLWSNVMVDQRHSATRKFTASLILNAGALFFAAAIGSFSVLSQPTQIGLLYFTDDDDSNEQQSGYISWLGLSNDNIRFLCSYVPPLLGLGLVLIVPWIFLFVASTYESYKSKVQLEISIFKRYTAYYFAYVIITSISITALTALLAVDSITSFGDYVNTITTQVPEVSGYFITVLTLKVFFGTTWELARPWALFSKAIERCCTGKAIGPRHLERSLLPDPCRYGWIYPQLLVVMAITLIYQVITPYITLFAFGYFSLAFMVFKNQALYVYVNEYESGGVFLPLLLDNTLAVMAGAQILLALFFLLSQEYSGALTTTPLPFATILFKRFLKGAYRDMLKNLTYDVAVYVDESDAKRQRSGLPTPQQNFSGFRYMQPWLTQRPVQAKANHAGSSGQVPSRGDDRRSVGSRGARSIGRKVDGAKQGKSSGVSSENALLGQEERSDENQTMGGDDQGKEEKHFVGDLEEAQSPMAAPSLATNSLLPQPHEVLVAAEPQWATSDDESDGEDFARRSGDGSHANNNDDDEAALDQLMVYSMLHPDQVDAAARAANRRHTSSLDSENSNEGGDAHFSGSSKSARHRTGSSGIFVPAQVSLAAADALAGGWAPAQGRRRGLSLVTTPLNPSPEANRPRRRGSDPHDGGPPSL